MIGPLRVTNKWQNVHSSRSNGAQLSKREATYVFYTALCRSWKGKPRYRTKPNESLVTKHMGEKVGDALRINVCLHMRLYVCTCKYVRELGDFHADSIN